MISTSIEINRVKQRLWISSIELVTRVRNEMKINDWWNRKENKKIQQIFFFALLNKKKITEIRLEMKAIDQLKWFIK